MKHLGDITKLNGHELPIVDIVTGGSPCQDLSVAGLRKGLQHESKGDEETTRSGLFMEQIRIVKEMRNECVRKLQSRGADVDFRHISPRILVWENVPGAFSSGKPKGADFRCVLEEICRIKDKDATIPMPKEGKWSTSGCIVGDGYSVAWRVHDAQFWGVPQRRKRISVVADFGGECAPEILFERKGVPGDTTESREERQGVATDTKRSTDKAISFQERAGKPGGGKGILIQDEKTGALSTLNNQSVCYGFCFMNSNSMKSANPHSGIYEADTSRTLDLTGGNPACNQGGMMVVQGADMYNQSLTGEKTMSITGAATDSHHIPCVVLEGNGQRESHKGDGYKESDVMYTLNTVEQHAVCIEKHPSVINVEMEVQKRKYEVDVQGLIKCLTEHRTMPISEIAEKLNKPKTMVEHWFRKDKCFSIPDADVWMELKQLLGIKTDKFDKSIMTYEKDGGSYDMRNRIHTGETAPTFTASSENNLHLLLENHPADSRVKISKDGIVQTLSSRMGTGGGNVPMVMESINGNIAGTLDANYFKGCGERQGVEREVVCVGNGQLAQAKLSDKVGALNCMHDQQAILTYGLDRASFNQGQNAKYNFSIEEEKIGSQVAKGPGAVCSQSVVRRLTPLECERLQGFPDNWTNIGEWTDTKGKKHKDADSPRYKALGNSIALPFWEWMAARIVKVLKAEGVEKPKMASLFDGISGFCLCFARAGVKPVFSSEIEEFPIAVAKKHFGDDDLGLEGDYEQYL